MTMDQVDLFSKLMLTDEERVVDSQLGYPHGYAKLCSQALDMGQLHGLVTPFTEGPPRRFLPYSPQSGDFATLKEWDGLFPTVADIDRDPQNARKYAEELWQQLDHLGNAGFDPAKFRIDPYGNVVYWNADPSSPLAWEIDHWFPHSRGGKTVMTNLRVVQWQASQRKKNRLEFLVPWWDLQHGCSINQFLSAFASKNADFRKRSFALFFSGGEDASVAREHVGECRPWPQQFREKKAQCGLAAAAIVMVHKVNDEAGYYRPPLKPLVVCDTNRSTVQLKEKHRLMKVDWQNSGKENKVLTSSTVNCKSSDHVESRHSSVSTTLQKELRVKVMRDEEKREKETEIAELEETVRNLKQQNEKERLLAVELEAVLSKHKRRVEKQRRWAETQSSYRLCLERMIRDTMHQSISYKEQARLNQAACNALKARLDCQKLACEAAEKDLLQNYSQRGILETSVLGESKLNNSANVPVQTIQGRDIVDVSSCVQDSFFSGTNCAESGEVDKKILLQDINLIVNSATDTSEDDEVYLRRTERRRTKLASSRDQQEECARKSLNEADPQVESAAGGVDLMSKDTEPVQLSCPESETLNKVSTNDLKQVQKDVIVEQSEINSDMIEKGVVYKEEYLDELLHHVRFQLEPNTADSAQAVDQDSPVRKSEEHLDELLHQVLATHLERMRKTESSDHGRQDASDVDDEKLRQIGKQNLDKWLQVLLFDVESAPCQDSPLHRAFSPSSFSQMSIAAAMRGKLNLEDNVNQNQEFSTKSVDSRPKGLWGVLLRKLSARQQSEQSLSNKLDAESDTEQTGQCKTQGIDITLHNDSNIVDYNTSDDASMPSRILSDITDSTKQTESSDLVPNSVAVEDGDSALDQHFVVERRQYLVPKALSDVDEISETDSLNSNYTSDSRHQLENKDPNKSGLRASIKAAGLVWKKAVKKLQDGPMSPALE